MDTSNIETTLDFSDTLLKESSSSDKYLILLEKALRQVQKKFNDDLKRLAFFVDGNESLALSYFNRTLYDISVLIPTNVIVSLTDSKSIHFKIFNKPNFETHLEVFYVNDEECDDRIEAVINVLENDQEIVKNFGLLDDILAIYREALGKSGSFIIDTNAVSH